MNGYEHYQEAVRLLDRSAAAIKEFHNPEPLSNKAGLASEALIARQAAQVHATLALAAAQQTANIIADVETGSRIARDLMDAYR